jgi:signal transduction histidine kinase
LVSYDHLHQSRNGRNHARPVGPAAVPSGAPAGAAMLEALAEATAEVARATDVPVLASALGRQLARLVPANSITVWLIDGVAPDHLTLAARWPRDASLAPSECLADDLWLMREAFGSGQPRFVRSGGSPLENRLRGPGDAALWVVPLGTEAAKLGVAYVASPRQTTHPEQTGRALAIFSTQATAILDKLRGRETARIADAKFLAVAAHDLKNTATSIKGYTQLLRRQLPADGNPRAARYAGVVEEQVGILSDALIALVDYGRVLSGRVALEREALDLRALLQAAADGLVPLDGSAQVALPGAGAPLIGEWDRARLQRALATILDSLRRAPTADGILEVSLGTVGPHAELLFGKQASEKVGEPNAWADGADLGLYLARGFIEAHGGTMSYRRTPDGEPILRVRLPLRNSAD